MEFDIRSLEKLRDRLKNSEKIINEVIADICNEAGLRILSQTVKNTPVDTGWLISNWEIGAIKKVPGGYQVKITNPVEYAGFVEYGHRIVFHGVTYGWKDGVFMLTIAEQKVKDRIDKIAEQRLNEALKNLLG